MQPGIDIGFPVDALNETVVNKYASSIGTIMHKIEKGSVGILFGKMYFLYCSLLSILEKNLRAILQLIDICIRDVEKKLRIKY